MKKFLSLVAAIFLVVAVSFSTASAKSVTVTNSSQEPPQQVDTKSFAAEVLRLTNKERAKVGAAPLKAAKDLDASALIRALELPKSFSHTRPNGQKFNTVFVSGKGHVVGENLAGGQKTPKQVVQAWMDSPSHRKNMLSKDFTELGVVYYYQPNSKFKHYWVQHFRG